MNNKLSNDDIIVWPDGTWCERENIHEYEHMSDDRTVLWADSPEWIAFWEQERSQ